MRQAPAPPVSGALQWVGTTSVNLTGGRVLGGGNLITNSAALNSDVIHVIQGYQSIDLVT